MSKKFIIESENSKGALRIKARSFPSSTSDFENIMDFATGQLTFKSNFRDKDCTSGLNATEAISLVSSNFIEVILRLKVLASLKEDLPLSLRPTKLR
jgi:hypothetical protein